MYRLIVWSSDRLSLTSQWWQRTSTPSSGDKCPLYCTNTMRRFYASLFCWISMVSISIPHGADLSTTLCDCTIITGGDNTDLDIPRIFPSDTSPVRTFQNEWRHQRLENGSRNGPAEQEYRSYSFTHALIRGHSPRYEKSRERRDAATCAWRWQWNGTSGVDVVVLFRELKLCRWRLFSEAWRIIATASSQHHHHHQQYQQQQQQCGVAWTSIVTQQVAAVTTRGLAGHTAFVEASAPLCSWLPIAAGRGDVRPSICHA